MGYIKGDATSWECESIGKLAQGGQLAALLHIGFLQPGDALRDRRDLENLWKCEKTPPRVWER